uniref:Putative tick 18.3 kDa family protein n=1 Tax=Rhipicephalus pulchellus TaxID=72859 RepID=L7M9P4_RHIPC
MLYKMKKITDYVVLAAVICTGYQCSANYTYRQRYDCNFVLGNSSPKAECFYRCTYDGRNWKRGMHQDGTQCLSGHAGRIGKCTRGVCVLLEDEGPSFNSTVNADRCSTHFHGKGYAPTCQYKCRHHRHFKRVFYDSGTPCIRLDEDGEPRRDAGICLEGVCKPYDELESMYQHIRKKVFAQHFHKCQDKDHYAINMLASCYYYCKQKNGWFYGYYKSNYNSRCEVLRPERKSGYCCKGNCIRLANCGQDLDTAANLLPQG